MGLKPINISEGVNVYDATCAIDDPDSKLVIETLHRAMERTGVRTDDPDARREVGDFVLRLAFATTENGPMEIDETAFPDGMGALLDTYDEYIRLGAEL